MFSASFLSSLKVSTWFFTTFSVSGMKEKVHYLDSLHQLFTCIRPEQIDIPPFVLEHDARVREHPLRRRPERLTVTSARMKSPRVLSRNSTSTQNPNLTFQPLTLLQVNGPFRPAHASGL